ncbi:hypothetical protein CAPTEDRAFT_202476 [Capitella teleta]|uniref:Endonuclease/exonuclease/phosphatase domain-containing protein n=1 Tax=Capitella teleta TaxID=283909 RepID=R7UID1_CAPTE|nr:hypothetical protein CAPTEDRAFT_202476 [Capitella teleta]|eukprot:ELU05960.1 hypothetical protein CAPTEDRAFT_202476 [Capitella teleta]
MVSCSKRPLGNQLLSRTPPPQRVLSTGHRYFEAFRILLRVLLKLWNAGALLSDLLPAPVLAEENSIEKRGAHMIHPRYGKRDLQKDLVDLVKQLPSPFFLLGYFNAHSDLWGDQSLNRSGTKDVMDLDESLEDRIEMPTTPRQTMPAPGREFLLDTFERLLSALNADEALRARRQSTQASAQEKPSTYSQLLTFNDDYPLTSWD